MNASEKTAYNELTGSGLTKKMRKKIVKQSKRNLKENQYLKIIHWLCRHPWRVFKHKVFSSLYKRSPKFMMKQTQMWAKHNCIDFEKVLDEEDT